MYDLQYIRKKKRRRVAAIVSLIAAIGVTSLVITSFLGRTVGTFTVSLQTSSVRLALSDKEEFKNPTSYLRIDNIPKAYYEYSYNWFNDVGMDLIDDEQNGYMYGSTSSGEALYYLKYTFYVKNMGNTTARYDMSINLDESTQTSSGKTLDDTLRIMLFSNVPNAENETHEHEVFAKDVEEYRYKVYDINGNRTYQAFISETPNPDVNGEVHEDAEHPLATSFRKDLGKTVVKKTVTSFKPKDIMRYTVVYWLEGEASYPEVDEEGNPINEITEAKIKLNINITAASYNAQFNLLAKNKNHTCVCRSAS